MIINLTLRIVLIAGALITLLFMLYRIRISKMQIKDSVFWIFFLLILLVFSVFPQIPRWLSKILKIQSPINFILLFVIFILIMQLFFASMRISKLDANIRSLAQRIAIGETDAAEKNSSDKQS